MGGHRAARLGPTAAIRSNPAYTFMERPRRNPTRVMAASRASATERLESADTAARTGMPAARAFCTSSNDAPANEQHVSGQRQPIGAQHRADHLVRGVVPADVLAQANEHTVGHEQAGGVQPSGALEL